MANLRFIPGFGMVDVDLLERFPQPEEGERFLLLADLVNTGLRPALLSLNSGVVRLDGGLPSPVAGEGRKVVVGFAGTVLSFVKGRLVETTERIHPTEVLRYVSYNSGKVMEKTWSKIRRQIIAERSVGGAQNNVLRANEANYIAEWAHEPTEVEGFADGAEQRIAESIEKRCEWLPFKVQVIGASRRFILYWSHSDPVRQFTYMTVAPRGRDPFNEEWKISNRFLNNYPPDKVHSGERPPASWGEVYPLLYRGPAWYLRLLINGEDYLKQCRVFVRDDTSFIVSDQCQRGQRKSGDGVDMQYGNQWAIDTWLLTYAVNRVPGLSRTLQEKAGAVTVNFKDLSAQEESRILRAKAQVKLLEHTYGVVADGQNTNHYSMVKEAIEAAQTLSAKWNDELSCVMLKVSPRALRFVYVDPTGGRYGGKFVLGRTSSASIPGNADEFRLRFIIEAFLDDKNGLYETREITLATGVALEEAGRYDLASLLIADTRGLGLPLGQDNPISLDVDPFDLDGGDDEEEQAEDVF